MDKKIALDTNIFILALENKDKLGENARSLLSEIQNKKPQVFTSVITIEEVFVKVFERGLQDKITDYMEFISGGGLISIVDVTRQIALASSKIRADYAVKGYKLRAPDTIQIATGLVLSATQFYTADKRLPKRIDGIRVTMP